MKIYDISMTINKDIPVYKNKPEKRPTFETTSDFTTGSAHETRVSMDVHTGTHVDAPLHMIPDGDTIETVTLEQLVRPARVVDMTHVSGGITKADLEKVDPKQGEFLLFKTINSKDNTERFNPEFVYLAADGAEYLAGIGIAGVGVDGLGVERGQPDHTTHVALFKIGAVIMEGLQLSEVEAGDYFMVAAPLKMEGIDAAPARVLLLEGVQI